MGTTTLPPMANEYHNHNSDIITPATATRKKYSHQCKNPGPVAKRPWANNNHHFQSEKKQDQGRYITMQIQQQQDLLSLKYAKMLQIQLGAGYHQQPQPPQTQQLQCPATAPTATTMSNDQNNEIDLNKLFAAMKDILEQITAINDCSFPYDPSKATIFDMRQVPKHVDLANYLHRFGRHARCSPSAFITALCYMDMLRAKDPSLHCTSHNVHRLLLTCITVAAKFLDDHHFNNAYFALIGGVSLKDLNQLEMDFLFRMQFDLHVDQAVFETYKKYLLAYSNNRN